MARMLYPGSVEVRIELLDCANIMQMFSCSLSRLPFIACQSLHVSSSILLRASFIKMFSLSEMSLAHVRFTRCNNTFLLLSTVYLMA